MAPQKAFTLEETDIAEPGCSKFCYDNTCKFCCTCCCAGCCGSTYRDLRSRSSIVAEAKLRRKEPNALAEDEKVYLVFKHYQEKLYFTNKRILFKHGPPQDWRSTQGGRLCFRLQKGRHRYRTIPYSAVGAWDCVTAGPLGRRVNFTLYTRIEDAELEKVTLYVRASGGGDVLRVHRHLSKFCLPKSDPFGAEDIAGEDDETIIETEDLGSRVFNFLKGDASELNPKDAEQAMAHPAPAGEGAHRVPLRPRHDAAHDEAAAGRGRPRADGDRGVLHHDRVGARPPLLDGDAAVGRGVLGGGNGHLHGHSGACALAPGLVQKREPRSAAKVSRGRHVRRDDWRPAADLRAGRRGGPGRRRQDVHPALVAGRRR
mmetsp:Transcript_4856/g.11974  ORF Transcript_4856/g.11974 Transcript_4856/m.11974 type:complete len:372 (-) Transcript_4856:2493-3608(-)